MRALWLDEGTISFRNDVPIPEPEGDEALIRVKIAGICATDLEQVRGYYPFSGIPGHEFVGVVELAPTEPGWVGQTVVGEINIQCGYCERCKGGLSNHCENRTVIGIMNHNGCFCEYLVLPKKNLYIIPENVSDEAAVFTEPIAAALEILRQVHIQPSDKVLVIGAGRLGQLIARVVSTIPCEMSILARYHSQKILLKKTGGIILDENKIPDGLMDFVIEATGSLDGFKLAQRAVRPRGTIILKSTYAGSEPINISSIVVDEITIVGSRCGPFPPALSLLELGRIDPTDLISGSYPLEDGVQAYTQAAETGVMKILIKI